MNIRISKSFVVLVASIFVATSFVVTSVSAQSSTASLEKQIADLQAQIRALTSRQVTTTSGGSGSCSTQWTRNLSIGSTGSDVRALQVFLNKDSGTRVADSGAGSPGNETSFYGPATGRAVTKFQEKYAANILTPLGLTSGTGGFYNSTRVHANSLCSSSSSTVGGGSVSVRVPVTGSSPVDGAISVKAGKQPLNGIAVRGALRVPFTVFTVTGPADGRATLDRLTIKLSGIADEDNFSSVALLDEDGFVVGNSRSINSDGEAVLTPRVSLRSSEVRQFTIAGNVESESSKVNAGEIARLDIVKIETDVNVLGLPVSGAAHTFNSSINLPMLDVDKNSDDGGTASTSREAVEFNEKNITFLSADLESSGSGRNEDLFLRSITVEQTGSANARDVDVDFVVDGKKYSPRVNNDRYSVVFSDPVVIESGDSVRFEVKGSVNEGDERTIQFQIEEVEDIYATDRRYGYGVSLRNSTEPVLAAGHFVVRAGTGRGRSESVTKDEVAPNADDVVLGEFEIRVDGEELEFEDARFTVFFNPVGSNASYDGTTLTASTASPVSTARTTATDRPQLSSLKLQLKDGGRRLANSDRVELDLSSTALNIAKIATGEFEGPFNLKDGRHTIQVIGDTNNEFVNNDRLTFYITSFSRVEGVTSGNRVTVAAPGVLDEITVDDGDFEILWASLSDTSAVSRAKGVVFGEIVFDANKSDTVEVKDIDLQFDATTDAADGRLASTIENCRLEDSKKKDLTDTEDPRTVNTDIRFDFDNDFIVSKGTQEKVFVACDIKSGVTANDVFEVKFGTDAEVEVRNRTRNETVSGTSSRTVTLATAGTLTVSTVQAHSSTNGEVVAVGDTSGSTEVQIGTFRLNANADDITLDKLTFQPVANIPAGTLDYVRVEAGGKVGRENVNGGARTTTQNIEIEDFGLKVEEGDDVTVKVYAGVNGIGRNGGAQAAGRVALQLLGASGAYEVRSGSGGTANVVASNANVSDFVAQRSRPTFSYIALPSADNSSLPNGTQRLYRFSVKAEKENLSLDQLAFTIATTTATATNAELKAYTNSSFSSTHGNYSGGLVGTAVASPSATFKYPFSSALQIARGETVYFELSATIAGSAENASVSITLNGDSGIPTAAAYNSAALTAGNVVWSPNSDGRGDVSDADSTATPPGDEDWFNGQNVITNDRLTTGSRTQR